MLPIRQGKAGFWLAGCAAMLAAMAFVVVGEPDPPEATADSGGSGPHCSTVTSPGTHSCHNHQANYYISTSHYVACVQYGTNNVCTEVGHEYRSCRRPSYSTAKCGSTPLGYYYWQTVASGPYVGDPINTSVTNPCQAGQHFYGNTCHSHGFDPPCGDGVWQPHPGHSWFTQPACATTTTAPPSTTAPTTTTAPPSCGSGQHRHTSSGSCHSHPSSCGWYQAISGSGHSWVWGGSCGGTTTTTTTTQPPTTTAPLSPEEECVQLHGTGWTPVLHPDGTPWTDSHGQPICAMPH